MVIQEGHFLPVDTLSRLSEHIKEQDMYGGQASVFTLAIHERDKGI